MTAIATITVLVDNHAGEGLGAEHGLSYWIETPRSRIVFDAGQSGMLRDNARMLGIDLSRADTVALSHGHYDHTGGLAHVLETAPSSVLHLHPVAVQSRFSRRKAGMEPVGMPATSRAALEGLPPGRIRPAARPTELADGVWLSGPVPRESWEAPKAWPFFLDDQATVPDPIEDDMFVWIDTPQGLVVLLGCCHSGLADTLGHIRSVASGRDIQALIGGLHLMDSDEREIGRVLDLLEEAAPGRIVPLHCTGDRATAMLQERFGPAVTPGHGGMRLTLPL